MVARERIRCKGTLARCSKYATKLLSQPSSSLLYPGELSDANVKATPCDHFSFQFHFSLEVSFQSFQPLHPECFSCALVPARKQTLSRAAQAFFVFPLPLPFPSFQSFPAFQSCPSFQDSFQLSFQASFRPAPVPQSGMLLLPDFSPHALPFHSCFLSVQGQRRHSEQLMSTMLLRWLRGLVRAFRHIVGFC